MQDEVNEKTIALYIKTGKLTAQTLQKAMKAILSKGKKQLAKPPQGKQSLKQLSSFCCIGRSNQLIKLFCRIIYRCEP